MPTCSLGWPLLSVKASDRYVPTCFNRVAARKGGGALAAGCFAGGLGGCSCTSSSHNMTRHVCVACQLPHASHTRTSFAGKSPQGRVAEPSPLAASLPGWQVASPTVREKTLCSKRFLAKMCQCPFQQALPWTVTADVDVPWISLAKAI